MKKITLLKSLFVVLALSLFSFSVNAEEALISNVFSSTTMQTSISAYDKTWDNVSGITLTLTGFNNNNKGWNYVRCGSKNFASVATIKTGQMSQKVTKVVVTVDKVTTASVNSAYLEVATDASFTADVQKINVTLAVGDVTYTIPTPAIDCYYRLVYDCAQGSSNGLIQISKVDFYYELTGAEVEATAITLDKTTLALEQYRETELNATLTPADAVTLVSWSSDNESVVKVANNGSVTAVGVGTATITAKAGELTATCAVTVAEATVLTCVQAAEYAASVSANNVNYVGGQYVVKGYVTEIATAYDENYKNISVWMADTKDGGQVFQLYRGKSTNETICKVGDYVEVVGYLTKYGTTPETAAGATYTVIAEPKPAITATWSMTEGSTVETFSEATITFTGVDAVKAKNSYGCTWFYGKNAEGEWQLVENMCTAGYMDAAASGTSFTLSVDPVCYSKDMKSPFSVKGEYRIVIPAGGVYFNGDKTNLNTEEYVLNFVIDNDLVELQEIDAEYIATPENNTTVAEIREIVLTFYEYEAITVAELDLAMGSNIPAFMKKDDLTGAMMPVGYIFFEAMADQANALRLYVPAEFMGMDAITMFGEYQIVIPAGVVTFGTAGTSKEIVLNYTIGEVEEELPMEVEFENIAAIYEMGMWDMAYYESYSNYEVVALLKSQPTVVDKVVTSGMMGGSMNNYYLNDGTGVIVLQAEGDIINPIMDENYENIIGYDTIPGLTIEVGKKLPVDFMANIDFKTVTDEETLLPTGEVYGAPVMMFVPKVTGVDEEGWYIRESNEEFVARCEASDFVEETVEVSIDSLLANRMDYAGKLVVVDTTASYYAATELSHMTGSKSTTAYMYWDAEEAFEVETWEEEETTYVFVSPKMTEDWNNYAGKLFNVKAENLPEAALDANVTIDVVKARFDWNSIAQGQTMIAKDYRVNILSSVAVDNSELAIDIYSNNGSVYVETEAGAMIEVYTVNGLRVYAGVSNTNTTVINGLSNIAIIRVNGEAYKVFVK